MSVAFRLQHVPGKTGETRTPEGLMTPERLQEIRDFRPGSDTFAREAVCDLLAEINRLRQDNADIYKKWQDAAHYWDMARQSLQVKLERANLEIVRLGGGPIL